MPESVKKIAIIGGGVMGLSCAMRLAEAGARVELFEARACGEGATLAALGALWPASPLVNGSLQQLHRKSLDEFGAFADELSRHSGLPVTYARLGRVEILDSAKHAEKARDEAVAAGTLPDGSPAMEFLSGEHVVTDYSGVAAAPNGALCCRRTAQVVVAELVAALRKRCEQLGVAIHEHTPVERLNIENGRVTSVQTDRGQCASDAVLAAAGAWSARVSKEIAAIASVRPAKGQGIAVEWPADGGLNAIVKRGPIYLVPWRERREILVGATTEPEAAFDESPTEVARQSLLQGAATILPSLANAKVLRHWAGLRPQNTAKGHPPIMGPHPRLKNLYICTGHFKTGIGMAPRVSRLMADLVLNGGDSPELQPIFP